MGAGDGATLPAVVPVEWRWAPCGSQTRGDIYLQLAPDSNTHWLGATFGNAAEPLVAAAVNGEELEWVDDSHLCVHGSGCLLPSCMPGQLSGRTACRCPLPSPPPSPAPHSWLWYADGAPLAAAPPLNITLTGASGSTLTAILSTLASQSLIGVQFPVQGSPAAAGGQGAQVA